MSYTIYCSVIRLYCSVIRFNSETSAYVSSRGKEGRFIGKRVNSGPGEKHQQRLPIRGVDTSSLPW